MSKACVLTGDCRDIMSTLDGNSVDAIVTDPPYGLNFMGKEWDRGVPGVPFWAEALRVLKPGGHMLAFGGTRTFHRLVVAIEDAGFDIRDQIMWLYGSGFPKSHDVSKAIDKAAGVEREVVGARPWSNPKFKAGMGVSGLRQVGGFASEYGGDRVQSPITAPATDAARQCQGWGTALKPSHEPICVARKPLDGTVAANWLNWGTGAINVDGCRVGGDAGRWPANVIHDGSDEVLAGFPGEGDKSASRFFYASKASKKDRDEGLEGFDVRRCGGMTATANGSMLTGSGNERTTARANHHPTVKPTDLMRYLCRLVTPPDGVILDPFCGSGSTGKAAVLEGFWFIGIELQPEYAEIARARIEAAQNDCAKELIEVML